jgi:hypothetical protein
MGMRGLRPGGWADLRWDLRWDLPLTLTLSPLARGEGTADRESVVPCIEGMFLKRDERVTRAAQSSLFLKRDERVTSAA